MLAFKLGEGFSDLGEADVLEVLDSSAAELPEEDLEQLTALTETED
jgi:hypothetical protein